MNRTALFVCEAGDSASAYYRADLPAKALRLKGWKVGVTSEVLQREDGLMLGFDDEGVFEPTRFVVCRRMLGPDGVPIDCSRMFADARKTGQRIIVDLDDDCWHVPPWNPAHGHMTAAQLKMWETDMANADAVTVTTDALGNSVMNHVPDAHVWYVRNGIHTESFLPINVEQREPLRLGWLGTTGHRGADLADIRKALYAGLGDKLGKVEFWHLGYRPEHKPIGAILPDMPVVTKSVDWMEAYYLPDMLRLIDVAIIPQKACQFADARSAATGLALAAAGVPFAASMTPEYKRLWGQGIGYPGDDWEAAIEVLTAPEYAPVRADIRIAGLAAVRKHWDYQTTVEDWEAAFNGID